MDDIVVSALKIKGQIPVENTAKNLLQPLDNTADTHKLCVDTVESAGIIDESSAALHKPTDHISAVPIIKHVCGNKNPYAIHWNASNPYMAEALFPVKSELNEHDLNSTRGWRKREYVCARPRGEARVINAIAKTYSERPVWSHLLGWDKVVPQSGLKYEDPVNVTGLRAASSMLVTLYRAAHGMQINESIEASVSLMSVSPFTTTSGNDLIRDWQHRYWENVVAAYDMYNLTEDSATKLQKDSQQRGGFDIARRYDLWRRMSCQTGPPNDDANGNTKFPTSYLKMSYHGDALTIALAPQLYVYSATYGPTGTEADTDVTGLVSASVRDGVLQIGSNGWYAIGALYKAKTLKQGDYHAAFGNVHNKIKKHLLLVVRYGNTPAPDTQSNYHSNTWFTKRGTHKGKFHKAFENAGGAFPGVQCGFLMSKDNCNLHRGICEWNKIKCRQRV